ncbi:hypothetical protein SISSUDRAFT_1067347 [Sistotremastrum suecicum HHB10207 ss-3]|uniref:Uncharacterized protein n=1 Tax=Sistotremastrum suecicum HHB10207 ss-3 TaxID=1314776 RepID=A0A165X816_9AGAM|nr:hypothetical protein SISSUDRAFT_1067347 [Sistotremastrum suecicum HHB10207 ss-3]
MSLSTSSSPMSLSTGVESLEAPMEAEEFLNSLEADAPERVFDDDLKHVRDVMQSYEDHVAKLLQEHCDFILAEVKSTKDELSLNLQTLETRVNGELTDLGSIMDERHATDANLHDEIESRLSELEEKFERAQAANIGIRDELRVAQVQNDALARELNDIRQKRNAPSAGIVAFAILASMRIRAEGIRQYIYHRFFYLGCVTLTVKGAVSLVTGIGEKLADRRQSVMKNPGSQDEIGTQSGVIVSKISKDTRKPETSALRSVWSIEDHGGLPSWWMSLRSSYASRPVFLLAVICALAMLCMVLLSRYNTDHPVLSMRPYREGMSLFKTRWYTSRIEFGFVNMNSPAPSAKPVPKTKTWNLTITKAEGTPTVSGIPPPEEINGLAQAVSASLVISDIPRQPSPPNLPHAVSVAPIISSTSPPLARMSSNPSIPSFSKAGVDHCNNVLAQNYKKHFRRYRERKSKRTKKSQTKDKATTTSTAKGCSWYESFGCRGLTMPPLDPKDPSVRVGDLFFHRFGREPQVWYCTAARVWSILGNHEVHAPTGRFLKFDQYGVVSLVLDLKESGRASSSRSPSPSEG